MPYVKFNNLFPDIAEKEMRTIIALDPNEIGVPPDEYGLVEMYCDEEDCDCRRVFLSVVSAIKKESVAVITYGWESKQFYVRWFNRGANVAFSSMDPFDQEAVNIMHGIHLNLSSYQSPIAPKVLEMVAAQALSDKAYVDRLKRHYKMFRKKIDERYSLKKVIDFPKKTQK